jgi:hypothetical protein
MTSETLPHFPSSKYHKPSIWSKIVAIREFRSLVPLAIMPKGKMAIINGHTLPQQLRVLKDGYLTALIGQRPFTMQKQIGLARRLGKED